MCEREGGGGRDRGGVMRWDMNKSGASRKGQDTKNQNCSNSEPVSRTRFGERFPAGIVTPRVVSERTTAGAAKRVRQHGTAVTFHTPTHRSMRPPVCHPVPEILTALVTTLTFHPHPNTPVNASSCMSLRPTDTDSTGYCSDFPPPPPYHPHPHTPVNASSCVSPRPAN